jgi:hypothetical protein
MTLLHAQAGPRLLRGVTVAVFAYWFAVIAFDPLHRLALLPASIFDPAGPLRLLPRPLQLLWIGETALHALRAATLAALALTLVSARWRPVSSLAACALLTLYQGVARGFAGHMDHKQIVLLYGTCMLAAAPWLDAAARRRGGAPRPGVPPLTSIPLVGFTAALCITYSLVACYRLLHGGLEVFTSNSLTFWALRNAYQIVHPDWGLGRLLLDMPLVERALNWGYPVVTAFELTAPLCLFSRAYRRAFLAVMIPFHLCSWVFMEVFFLENLALYLLLIEWDRARPERA